MVKHLLPEAALGRLTHLRWAIQQSYWRAARHHKEFGLSAALTLTASEWLGTSQRIPMGHRPLWRVQIPGFRHPVHYREGATDVAVMRGIFPLDGYGCVGSEPDVRTIVDCGANIGLATFYLLHRYPQARAVVVEPDSENLRVARRNLAPFADRVQFIQAGVWSSSLPVVVDRGSYRDGGEWAFQIRPVRTGETPDFNAVTIDEIMHRAGISHIDLLKIDIEAAETEVFSSGVDNWLPQVRTLAIELHGPECEAAVNGALSRYSYQVEHSGELTIYRGITSL